MKLDHTADLKTFVSQYKGELFSSDYDDTKLDRKINEFIEIARSLRSVTTSKKLEKPKIEENSPGRNYNPRTPICKINQHKNLYYFFANKFRELPDDPTAFFFGYKIRYKDIQGFSMSADEIRISLGEPMRSILETEIWYTEENPTEHWLIYDNQRHYLTPETMNTLQPKLKSKSQIRIVGKDQLHKLIQGNVFDTSKIN